MLEHDYTVGRPILGGELSFHTNLTSLTQDSAAFDPINQAAANLGLCAFTSLTRQFKTPANCLCAECPAPIRVCPPRPCGGARSWILRSGLLLFVSLRGDLNDVDISKQPGVDNFITPGHTDLARFMPTVGLEYRYPFINVQPWGTQTIEPIAQILLRLNETNVESCLTKTSSKLVFDAGNLFKVDKFSGWDRMEEASAECRCPVYRAVQSRRLF